MGYAVALVAPKQIELVEYDEPPLQDNQVRLRTLYSGISAGMNWRHFVGPVLTSTNVGILSDDCLWRARVL
jgi:hypothetical protein